MNIICTLADRLALIAADIAIESTRRRAESGDAENFTADGLCAASDALLDEVRYLRSLAA